MTRPALVRLEAWRLALALVKVTGCDRTVGPVGADGVCLVPSRSVVDAHHEVRIVDGAAVSCTCWPSRKGKPCVHRMAVAVRLWGAAAGLDLADVPIRAVLPLLVGVYLEPPAGRPQERTAAGPERRLAG